MDRQLIKDLIDALERSGLSELEYASDGEVLRLVKAGADPTQAAAPARPAPAPSLPTSTAPPPPAPQSDVLAITAPLYGVVHLRPNPEAEPFIALGQMATTGQVLLTIEAMKVFTEVRAPHAGRVEAVLVADGQEVEPGRVLMRLA